MLCQCGHEMEMVWEEAMGTSWYCNNCKRDLSIPYDERFQGGYHPAEIRGEEEDIE